MSLYTQRHGMRAPINKTYQISIKAYSLLFDCCSNYFVYLSWKYPAQCPDGRGCCGLDNYKFNEDLEFEIPTLFRRDDIIDKPHSIKNVFDTKSVDEEYDQYALIDLIEFVAQNIHDIRTKEYHSFYNHYDMSFATTCAISQQFVDEINAIFQKTGLLYNLTYNLEIERIEELSILGSEIESNIATINEPGLKELLSIAMQKHKSPYPGNQADAVEKIWDAFERLKTYYTSMNKSKSAEKIVNDMADGNADFVELFDAEFRTLTTIGNDFRIRHHETNKIDITDIRYYDYFFNRCLSLIATAILYLEQ